MQSRDGSSDVLVTFYCKRWDSTAGKDCASFYTTNRRSWIVQGDRCGEQVAGQLQGLKPSETFLEIPETLVEVFVRRYVEERYGIDLSGAAG